MTQSIIQTVCTALVAFNQTFGEHLVTPQLPPNQPITGVLIVNKYFEILSLI